MFFFIPFILYSSFKKDVVYSRIMFLLLLFLNTIGEIGCQFYIHLLLVKTLEKEVGCVKP